MRVRVWPGDPYPLGATWTGVGVNFALFSEHATKVELCLFDSPDATRESASHRAARTDRHGLARLPAGCPARPALRLSRPRPVRARSTAIASTRNKVVLDPYAKAVARTIRWADEMFGYTRRRPERRPVVRRRATTPPFAPLAAVVDPAFTWGDDRPPRTPWHKTVIYEMHVRGFTKLHPDDSRARCAAPTQR